MYYALSGLGAFPNWPGSGLQSGHEWVRYLIGSGPQAGEQWRSCPAGASFGCTMSGGYAWGQRPEGIGEHNFIYIAPPTQTSTGEASVMPDIQEECRDSIFNWVRSNPDGACLNDEEYYQLIDWCVAWRNGNMTDYGQRKTQLVADACVRKGCEDFYDAWAQAVPDQAACLNYQQREQAKRICRKAEHGTITRDDAAQRLHDLVVSACTSASPPPSPPPQDAPGTPATPPADETLPPDLLYPEDMPTDLPGGGFPGGGGAAFPLAPMNGEDKGAARFLGPIVGIGLLAAVGLTIARTAKKKR